MTVNGVLVLSCSRGVASLPEPHNGGFCFQVSAGTPNYASFFVY